MRLARPLERAVAQGHPWLYREALRIPPGLVTGTIVDVLDRAGGFLARGLYDAESPLAVRVATRDQAEALDAAFLQRRVQAALRARRGVIDFATTDAFRWLNGEGDLLPGVVVDVYADVAVLRLDGDAVRVWRDELVRALQASRPALKHVYERARGGRGEALFGGLPRRPVEVREHGIRFAVDVIAGQKTGLFLDQRENRRLIGQHADGLAALNLFAYTGGFSLAAALGGARHVTTLDSAPGAVADAQANFALNGLDSSAHAFVCADAFAWLEDARRARRRFGLVICDPPSFAPSERARGPALKAYRDLFAAALDLVEDEGLFAPASCSSHVDQEAFLQVVAEAAAQAGRPLRLLEVRGQPGDHPSLPAFPEGRYLKFALARVA